MKFLIITLLIGLTSMKTLAQQDINKDTYHKYTKLKNTGVVLMAVGAVLFVAGGYTFKNSSHVTNGQPDHVGTNSEDLLGLAGLVTGGACLSTGLVLYAKSSHLQSKYKRTNSVSLK